MLNLTWEIHNGKFTIKSYHKNQLSKYNQQQASWDHLLYLFSQFIDAYVWRVEETKEKEERTKERMEPVLIFSI